MNSMRRNQANPLLGMDALDENEFKLNDERDDVRIRDEDVDEDEDEDEEDDDEPAGVLLEVVFVIAGVT